MTLIQWFGSLFLLSVIVQGIRRARQQDLPWRADAGWMLLWCFIAVLLLVPTTTEYLARFLGVGRGVDAVVYLLLIFSLYLHYRQFLHTEQQEQEITKIVRALAVKEVEKK